MSSEETQQEHFTEEEMTPKEDDNEKNQSDFTTQDIEMDGEDIDGDDLDEIRNVSNNLDSLNSALDVIEQMTDTIKSQLLELLHSNREIREEMQAENNRATAGQGGQE